MINPVHYISIDGTFIARNAPVFGIDNRSFAYGDGFFETIRITSGGIPLLKRHIERVRQAAELIQIELPEAINYNDLYEHFMELANKNTVTKDGKIRLQLFRAGNLGYAPQSNKTHFSIDITPINDTQGFELNARALKVDLYHVHKKPCNAFSAFKTSNALLYVLAGKYKQDNQLDDAVILNDKHQVCEFISSNLFIVINGVLYTPALSEGCIDGIMRKVIIEIAAKARINVYETALMPNDLIRADEIFMTNALYGIQWIGAYKSKRYFNKVSKVLADLLQEEATRLLNEHD